MTKITAPNEQVPDADSASRLTPHICVHPTGEFHTKSSRTRRRFERILLTHLRERLREAVPEARLVHEKQRIRVFGDNLAEIGRAASSIFGVHRTTQVHPIAFSSLDSMADAVADAVRGRITDKVFAVRVRRRGTHCWSSTQANRAIGNRLYQDSAGVDLKNPQEEVRVEVYQDVAELVTHTWQGPSGLPTGGQERSLSLMSGGIDSPVAAWMLMRRGSPVDFVHFILECSQSEHALTVTQSLWEAWGCGPSAIFWMVDFQPIKEALIRHVDSRVRQVVLKQLMIATADELAARLGIQALVTGEAVGQVSSQTLSHLAAIDSHCRRALIRPLSGMLKEEIVEWARRIGTYEISSRAKEVCDISEGPVATVARWSRLDAAHDALPEGLVEDALETLEVVALEDWFPGSGFVKVLQRIDDDDLTEVLAMEKGKVMALPDGNRPVIIHGSGSALLASHWTQSGRDVKVLLHPTKGPQGSTMSQSMTNAAPSQRPQSTS